MNVFNVLFLTVWSLLRVVLIVVAWTGKRGWRALKYLGTPRAITYGSARWAGLLDLWAGDALGGKPGSGVIVGKAYGSFLRFRQDGATLVYAPMGKGKGVGIVIPNLLDHRGAAVVTDPKGENYAKTHRYRSSLGPVFRLNAINPYSSHRFNPLDTIRRGTLHEGDDAALIAEFLVTPEGLEGHWDTSARALIKAVIRHVLHTQPRELRTLATVRQLLAADMGQFTKLLEEMAGSPISNVAEEGQSFLASLHLPEPASVKRNAAKALEFWSRDSIGGRLSATSDFDLMWLHQGAMSLYVMVPDHNLAVYRPFLRVMMGCAVAALMRGKELPRPQYKPLLMIDECAALGRLQALESGMGLLREYTHTVLVWQDLGQMRAIYGAERARSFMSASGCQVTFGVSDIETARNLAEDIGRTTVLARSAGQSEGNLDLVRAQHQDGRSEAGRYLLDPAEIRRLDNRSCLIFLQDQVNAPIRAGKVRYYEERCWHGLHDDWRGQAEVIALPPQAPGQSEAA